MTKYVYLSWLFALLLLFPIDGYAPCVIFTPPDQWLNSAGQRAFIAYTPEAQQVHLIPSINFSGEAVNFAVVIPTPSVPKLDTVNQRVFWELSDLTSTVIRWRGDSGISGCNPLSEDDTAFLAFDEAGVDVISEQRVGAFDTVILTADNPTALTEWLDEHGYHHSIQDNMILQSYIDQRWVFTAMRLNSDQSANRDPWAGPFFNATVDPVLMTYTAESLIYPLRLTSISAREGADVTVYILSKNKMHFPGARVEYANQISDSERDVIRQRYPIVGSFIGTDRYLTRLRRGFARTEMDTDFQIIRHRDNQEFRRVQYQAVLPFPDYLVLGLVAFGYFLLRRIRLHRRWA